MMSRKTPVSGRVKILDIQMDSMTKEEALNAIEARLWNREISYVVFVNVDVVIKADGDFKQSGSGLCRRNACHMDLQTFWNASKGAGSGLGSGASAVRQGCYGRLENFFSGRSFRSPGKSS